MMRCILAVIVWAAMGTVVMAQDGGAGENSGRKYVCPPCAGNCHDRTFDKPGHCPVCGMTLIEKGTKSTVRNVAIVLWNGVELLDFSGPGEVFSSARGANGNAFNVYTVASTTEPIVSQRFVTIHPQYSIQDCPEPVIVVLPGGGTGNVVNDEAMIAWVQRTAKDAELMLSVCTGAMVLARAGLLDGLEATTYHGAIDALRLRAPNTVVYDNRRFVDNGRVITSAGVSAGIDSSLYVVARLLGEEAAWTTAKYMEYDWQPAKHEAPKTSNEKPALTIAQRFQRELLDRGVADAIRTYEAALASGDTAERLSEHDVNEIGYNLLYEGRAADAVRVLDWNVAHHADSWNAYDSLAEAQLAAGQTGDAVANYRRTLEFNPKNTNALTRLQQAIAGSKLAGKSDRQARTTLREFASQSKISLAPAGEPGEPIVVSGTVKDDQGRPISGALINVYHADAQGMYTPRKPMDEPNARLFGYLRTGDDGQYELRTIRPGGYANSVNLGGQERYIPQHIHFEIYAEGYADKTGVQMVFEDDPRMDEHWREWARRAGHPVVDVQRTADGTQRCTYNPVLHKR